MESLSLGPISFILIQLLLFGPCFASARNYSYNYDKLKELAYSELNIVKEFIENRDHILDSNPMIQTPFNNYIQDFQESKGDLVTGWTMKDAKEIADNPIAAYRLLVRYERDLPLILFDVLHYTNISKKFIIYDVKDWPTLDDVNGAGEGIVRIQHFHDLDPLDIVEGKWGKFHTGAKLSTMNCYELGQYSLNLRYLALAVQWFEVANERVKLGVDRTILSHDESALKQALIDARIEHDKVFRNTTELSPLLFDAPIYPNISDNSSLEIEEEDELWKNRTTRRESMYHKYKGSVSEKNLPATAWAICKGETFQTEAARSKLFCWLEHHANYTFFIGPMKMEFLTRNPDLVMIHDYVRSRTIRRIKKFTRGKLQAQFDHFYDPDSDPLNLNQVERHSVKKSFDDRVEDSVFRSIPRIPHYLFGLEFLKPSSAEWVVVKSYAFTGTISLHFDTIPSVVRDGGTIFGSTLVYMNSVRSGGETVFPVLGIKAPAIKGSAIFWYPGLPGGKNDDDFKHASCPVLMGQKIVLNKWNLYNDQFKKYPCFPDPLQRTRILVNGKIN